MMLTMALDTRLRRAALVGESMRGVTALWGAALPRSTGRLAPAAVLGTGLRRHDARPSFWRRPESRARARAWSCRVGGCSPATEKFFLHGLPLYLQTERITPLRRYDGGGGCTAWRDAARPSFRRRPESRSRAGVCAHRFSGCASATEKAFMRGVSNALRPTARTSFRRRPESRTRARARNCRIGGCSTTTGKVLLHGLPFTIRTERIMPIE